MALELPPPEDEDWHRDGQKADRSNGPQTDVHPVDPVLLESEFLFPALLVTLQSGVVELKPYPGNLTSHRKLKEFAATRSSFPSPFRSPIATELG